MASTENEEDSWPDISNENRTRHEILFYSQGPVDGYLIGEYARDLFLHSRLPITVLSKIWNLADVSNDNLLNVDEFVLCMHLIQEVIKGRKLPADLPKNLKPTMSKLVDLPAISSLEREAYVKVFQTVDSSRKGYLEALIVRPLFQASKVKPEILAKVWDLSDINKDGVLDLEEWIVACHLIRLIKQGTDLDGSVNPFTFQTDKISQLSLQARKARVNQYEEHKQRLMTLKEKRKNQTLQEQKRLDLLKEKCNIEKELCTLLQNTGNCPLTADEILNLNTKNTEELDKLEEIVSRLKKEHEKIRQETVRVILGEQKLQDEIRLIKKDTDLLNERLGTKHTKATKDPDPFHQLYEQRKEERKKSNLSEGEEPEVHYPFKISPFDKEALSWKSLTGSDVFLTNHIVDNNNSKQSVENDIILENLHEFSDKFIENWSSKNPVMETDEDTVFMKVDVKPEEYNQWLGAGWKDEEVLSSDNPQFLRLHKKLVELKREMQKLNGEVGGRLMFRNPSDYLARKKEKEEEEQKEKSRFARRSKSSADKDYIAKRRSYVTERDESDFKERKSKRGSYTFDHSYDSEPKRTEKSQRRSLNLTESHIPKPVKTDSKTESLKKSRAPLPPSVPQSNSSSKSTAPKPPVTQQTEPESSPDSSQEPQTENKNIPETNIVPPVKGCEQIEVQIQKEETEVVESAKPGPVKPSRPPRKKKEAPKQPSFTGKEHDFVSDSYTSNTTTDFVSDTQRQREVISHHVPSDGEIDQVTVEEEIVVGQSNPVESGTYTFRQVQIVNPAEVKVSSKTEDISYSDQNVKGILKKSNWDTSSENNNLENNISAKTEINSKDNIHRDVFDGEIESEYIINKSGRSLPDNIADTISLTSLTSVESAAPPLPESIPPLLPDIPPPTPVLSRKIEVRKPHIDIEEKTQLTMEDTGVEEEIIQIQSSAKVQSEASSSREEVVSPHSQKMAEMRDQFFGVSKSPPPVIVAEENVPTKTAMDVYLNDLQLEAKTKELEEAGSDSDMSDSEDKVEFEAVFIPGDGKTGAVPTSPDADESEIHLISYNTTSVQSPVSQADSAFEDMSSMDNSNHVSLSSTLEDFPEALVGKETNREVKEEFSETSDHGSMSPPESSPRKPQRVTSPPVTLSNKSFMAKANQFSSSLNEPPKVHIRANTKEMSAAHIQEVDAQRKAVIMTSTVKRKNVGWEDQEEESGDPIPDTSPSKPNIEVQKTDSWRENSRSVAGINWEEKPDKVDLYSKNITSETETSEIVDRESIADLSSTRKQWESFYRSTSQEPNQSPKKKVSSGKHWEVKLPYKSENVPQPVVERPKSPDTMSETETDPYAHESAIDREIRLANEREEMLRKEQEERMELLKRQTESKQNFENKNNNNSKEFKTMYHEMTEADRGSELQIRETMIKQEILENAEREKALKGVTHEEESEGDSNETVIAREIRLQREREEEMSKQHTNGDHQENGEDMTYEEAIGTYQHEGESLIARELREHREREEELQKQRNALHNLSMNTQKSPEPEQKAPASKVSTTSSVQKQQKPPTIQKQMYSPINSSPDNTEKPKKHVQKPETPIEREIRLARERENELRAQKGLPLLQETPKEQIIIESKADSDEEEVSYYRGYSHNSNDTHSMRKFASSRLQNELQKQKERENTYRKEGKIITTSEEHIETPMKFNEVPQKLSGPVKRNFVIRKSVSEKPQLDNVNGETESKDTKSVTSPPQPNKEEPKFRLKTGGAAFSYRETRQHAESKIEKELREMREREEELKSQRRSSGLTQDS